MSIPTFIDLNPYADRILDTTNDYHDPLVVRTLVKVILQDVICETAQKLDELLPEPTRPPKATLLGTFTRDKGIQP